MAYDNRRPTRRSGAHFNQGGQPYSGSANNPYGMNAYATPPQPKRSIAPVVVAVVLLLGVLAAALWLFVLRPKPITVVVNGERISATANDTVSMLVDKGYAKPTPGNLVAVDGSLLTEGAGGAYTATINGEPAEPDTKLVDQATVEIGNGSDVTEDYTTTEQAIPFGTSNSDTSFSAYWNGSIHRMSDGVDGVETVKTGNVSGISVTEVTTPPVDGGYHIYTVQTDDPVIALTFDDGPWPETTEQILDILQQYDAKATFFTIGNQIANYSSSVKRAYDMGCEICTHTWDHAAGSGQGVSIAKMSPDEQVSEVTRGMEAIKQATGADAPRILRAPGGNFYGDVITNLWSLLDAEIGWDVDTEDWSRPGVEAIYERILSVRPGQVILMHDGGGDRSQTVEALRQAMPVLVERGYRFVTIDELLAYPM